MITLHPAARQTLNGFIPMVTLRKDKGRMVGSKVSQDCNVFTTEAEARAHALLSALRAAMRFPEFMTVCKA